MESSDLITAVPEHAVRARRSSSSSAALAAYRSASDALASPAGLAAIVALGAALRLVRYLQDRSLWLDESYLALNLMTRSYSHLVGALDFNQGAPVGFLVLEKLMLQAFGDSEHVLRLLPLLAGLASLPLFLALARMLLPRHVVPLALLLFAVLDPLVYYSDETKQYGLDVAVGLALLVLFARALRGPLGVERLTPVAAAGIVAPWLSDASVFFLAGFGIVAAVKGASRRDARSLGVQGLVYAFWLASFGTEYMLSIRHLGQLRQSLQGTSSTSSSVLKNLYVIFNDPGQLPRTVVGVTAVLAAAGAVVLWRRRQDMTAVIAATSATAAAVGFDHRYPIGDRFILFLLPPAILLVAAGAGELLRLARGPVLLVGAAAATALVLVPALATTADHLVHPPDAEPAKPLIAYVAGHWRPGDTLYLYQMSQYAFRYYLSCRDCNAAGRHERSLWPFRPSLGIAQTAPALVSETPRLVVGSAAGHDLLAAYTHDLSRLRGRGRVWLLFTHYWPYTEQELRAPLDRAGRRLAAVRAGAALLYLYDFSR